MKREDELICLDRGFAKNSQEYEQLRQLIILVDAMRKAQKAFFKTRNNLDLMKSKRLEADVDKFLKEVQDEMNQPRMPF